MAKVKKEFFENEEIAILGDKIIGEKNIQIGDAKIGFLEVVPNISKTVAARCIRANNELQYFSDYQYIIEVSSDVWNKIDDKTRSILLEHELRHILVVMNEKSGEWQYKLQNHDVMDFYSIIKEHGIDWLPNFKTIISSLYDLKPEDVDRISI